MTGDRYRTPVPKRDIEIRSSGSGPVITYKLSPEELERYRAMPVSFPNYSDGKPVKKPIVLDTRFTPEEKSRRAKKRYEEEKPVSEQSAEDKVPFSPSKEEFLKGVASGKSISKLDREWGMGSGALHYWIRKWDLKGIKPERAQQLLDVMALDGSAAANDKTVPDAVPKPEPRNQSEWRQKLSDVIGERNRFRDLYSAVESENEKLRQERDDYKRAAEDLKAKIDAQSNRDDEITMLKEQVENLKADRQVLLSTIEKASTPSINDTVDNQMDGMVCPLDAIDSAVVGLYGSKAFHTGAAISYLWRWEGIDDLRKAKQIINRLIESEAH